MKEAYKCKTQQNLMRKYHAMRQSYFWWVAKVNIEGWAMRVPDLRAEPTYLCLHANATDSINTD